MRDETDAPELAAQFAMMARTLARDGAALYARVCSGVAGDPELLGLVAASPPEQRRPNLLLAAVHFLVLGGADGPLARWYPTVGVLRAAPLFARSDLERADTPADAHAFRDPVSSDQLYRDFSEFCRTHRNALTGLLATRATQTNEVGRCSALLPGLAHVHRQCRQPLALIDLGTSAGLNLLFDRYSYHYSDGRRSGNDASPVRLDCEIRHGRPPIQIPPITERIGIDQHPVDPGDDDEARWLLACQWPDQLERFYRVLHALEVARASARPLVVAGDLVSKLAGVAATVAEGSRLCVLHSWAVAYLAPERQRRLTETLEQLGKSRPVSWIFAESPYEVPELPIPNAPVGRQRGSTALVHVALDNGRRAAERLGDLHPHGRWLQWWGPAA